MSVFPATWVKDCHLYMTNHLPLSLPPSVSTSWTVHHILKSFALCAFTLLFHQTKQQQHYSLCNSFLFQQSAVTT